MGIFGVQKFGIQQTSQHTPVVTDWWLSELLGVTDIALGEFIEGVSMALWLSFDFLGNVFGFGGHFPSHCVLRIQHTRVYFGLGEEESRFFAGEECSTDPHQ